MRDDYSIYVKANIFFTSSLWYWFKHPNKMLIMTAYGWSLSERFQTYLKGG